MKKLLFLFACTVSISACSVSNGPQSSQTAVMPKVGSEFTYQVVYAGGTLTEQTTITNVATDTFTAIRRSDTVNGFSTSDVERYVVRSNGDLFLINSEPLCDTIALPIASERNYSIGPGGSYATPTKLNGFVDSNSSVVFQTLYNGQAMVRAAGTDFDCSSVSRIITVIAESPLAGRGVDTSGFSQTYWYSPDIGFFVKDIASQLIHGRDSGEFNRTLVSYRLQ